MAPPKRISLRLPLAVIAAAGVLAGVGLSTASAQPAQIQQSTSRNWAGYVVRGTKFSSVSGSWVVPAANGPSEGYSATWVGLGGATRTSRALEQVGTESDYVHGAARYYAWYELVPAASARLKLAIHPGDQVSATVSVSGTRVTLSLSDLTTGASVTNTRKMSHPDTASAEWIAEAPSMATGDGHYRVLRLADFGTVTFTKASATAGGHTGSISDPDWSAERVQLVSSTGGLTGPPGSALPVPLPGTGLPGPLPADPVAPTPSGNATTSALSSDGSSFSVSWSPSGSATGY